MTGRMKVGLVVIALTAILSIAYLVAGKESCKQVTWYVMGNSITLKECK